MWILVLFSGSALALSNTKTYCNNQGESCLQTAETVCHGSCPSGWTEIARHRSFSCDLWAGTYATCQVASVCTPYTVGELSESKCPKIEVPAGVGVEADAMPDHLPSPSDPYREALLTAKKYAVEVGTDAAVEADFRALVATLERMDVLTQEVDHVSELLEDVVAQLEADARQQVEEDPVLVAAAGVIAAVPYAKVAVLADVVEYEVVKEVLEITFELATALAARHAAEDSADVGRRASYSCCATTYKSPDCTAHPLHWYQCKSGNGYTYDHSKSSDKCGAFGWGGQGYCTNSCGARDYGNGCVLQ